MFTTVKFKSKFKYFHSRKCFENVVCNRVAIVLRPQWAKVHKHLSYVIYIVCYYSIKFRPLFSIHQKYIYSIQHNKTTYYTSYSIRLITLQALSLCVVLMFVGFHLPLISGSVLTKHGRVFTKNPQYFTSTGWDTEIRYSINILLLFTNRWKRPLFANR